MEIFPVSEWYSSSSAVSTFCRFLCLIVLSVRICPAFIESFAKFADGNLSIPQAQKFLFSYSYQSFLRSNYWTSVEFKLYLRKKLWPFLNFQWIFVTRLWYLKNNRDMPIFSEMTCLWFLFSKKLWPVIDFF